MARPKLIEDQSLIDLANDFFLNECDRHIDKFKIPRFAEFVRNNGYPTVADYIIRRNNALAEHLKHLEQSDLKSDEYVVLTYRTIDVENFVGINTTPAKMKAALNEINTYTKRITQSALRLNERSNSVISENEQLRKQLKDIEETTTNDRQTNQILIKKTKELEEEVKALNQLIDTYIYPEIANELLEKMGLLRKSSRILKKDSVIENIIDDQTEVKSNSNLIRGLFKGLDE